MSDLVVNKVINTQNKSHEVIQKPINNPKSAPETDKELGNAAKYMIGATVLGVVIMAGIIGHKNNWWRKTVQEVKPDIEDITNTTLELFRKAGNKIEKGHAKLANGELYTGTLTHQTKDGKSIEMTYKDGLLQRIITNKDEKMLKNISCEYDDSGNKTAISVLEGVEDDYYYPVYERSTDFKKGVIATVRDGKNEVKDIKTGKILRENGVDYYYNNDGSLRYSVNSMSGFAPSHYAKYYPNGKYKFYKSGNSINTFDENGNEIVTLQSDFRRGGCHNGYTIKYPNQTVKYHFSQEGKSKEYIFYDDNSSRAKVRLNSFYLEDGTHYLEASVWLNSEHCWFNRLSDNLVEIRRFIERSTEKTPSARYNPITKEIKLLNDKLTKDSIENMVKEIENCIRQCKQVHKDAIKIENEFSIAEKEIHNHDEWSKHIFD